MLVSGYPSSESSDMLIFREVNIDDAELILKWRKSPRVDSMMLSSISSSLEEQIQWLSSAYSKTDYYHWIINDGFEDIGLVSMNRFSPEHSSTSWGYYIGEENQLGAGATVPAYFYNFIFSQGSPITEVTAEVLSSNPKVIRMHELYGYVPTEELDHDIELDGEAMRIVTMKLDKETWGTKKAFHGYISNFPTQKWSKKPENFMN